MPETLLPLHKTMGRPTWNIFNTIDDLVTQAGLNKDDIQSELGPYFRYKGRIVILSHEYEKHMVVSMEGEEDSDLKTVIDAFSKVVEYEPFCKYNLLPQEGSKAPILLTYEWDKVDSKSRYEELSSKETVSDLTKI